MKFVAILSAILLPALALAEEDSTTTCTSTTTMTKTITLTNEYTTSVYSSSSYTTEASESSTDAEKPTVAADASPSKSSPVTVPTGAASSMHGDYNLAAIAGLGIAVAALF